MLFLGGCKEPQGAGKLSGGCCSVPGGVYTVPPVNPPLYIVSDRTHSIYYYITKLFNVNEILTVHNLYDYHMLLSISMILQSNTPVAHYPLFKMYHRKPTLIIAPIQVKSFVFLASILWNTFRTLPEGREIKDFFVGVSFLKNTIKSLIFRG